MYWAGTQAEQDSEAQRQTEQGGAVQQGDRSQKILGAMVPESSPGELHPKALAEPYVNVSVHTAPIIQPGKAHQVANGQRA